ncbi:MAG: ElyC/SanA/YdcF family protein [Cellulosilyticaceae bacterium]
MNLYEIAEKINILGEFCGKRDMERLSKEALFTKYKILQADLLILFGGSIPEGCDIAGRAITEGLANKFMIVGGEGHTTKSLWQKINSDYPQIETLGKAEADVMQAYIAFKYGIKNILLERKSTNCGNNVTYALDEIRKNSITSKTIIIIQDSTMQHRMEAGFRKYLLDKEIKIINFAAYKVKVTVENGELVFEQNDIWGMWSMVQYITLLMGEIPRLMDNKEGYGPNGKDFIAHVNIPKEVMDAFKHLKEQYGDLIRVANPLYASK